MADIPLTDLHRHLERLPPFPETATRALEELGRDNIDFTRVEQTVGADLVLTARILRMANSPFYGLAHTITSVRDACMLTGAPTLRNLIVASVAIHQFPTHRITGFDHAAMWRHSAQCAAFASALAIVARQPRDVAFTAGLLHDVGKLVFTTLFPAEYAQVCAHGGALDAEREVFGVTHAEVGALLIETWRLPTQIRDAIAAHHDARPQTVLTDIVRAANVLAHATADAENADAAWARVHAEVRARLPLATAAERAAVYAQGQTLAAEATEMFSGA